MPKPIGSSTKKLEGLNICMLTPFYLPYYGGMETLIYELSKELVGNKINIHILTGSHPKRREEAVEEGIHVTRTRLLSHRGRETYHTDDTEFYNYFIDYLERNKIDIIHSHMIYVSALPIAGILQSVRIRTRIPILLHQHCPPDKPAHEFVLKIFNWDYIIPVSRWVAKHVYEIGVPPEKIKTIPNFVDVEKFKPGIHSERERERLIDELKLDLEKRIILMPSRLVGRDGKIDERKNFDTMIHALSHLSTEKDFIAILTAVEDDAMPKESKEAKKKLWEMAEVLEVENKIRIPDENIDQAMMPALYSLSDIVVLPSSREPFGLVYVEGMASGKPVVGAISGAAPEVIKHNRTGLLVESRSPFALFQALKKLIENMEKAEVYGKNGRELVLKKYSLSRRVTDFLTLYRKILKVKKRLI
ncbi:MAG: glycosyltransferase family 4 protein [Candidatus Aenigmarchaeota archaeon]|nr:glycosyltransferase family 4 protein [Candidatus Aenigmarchaeota archaeon]